MTPGEKKAWNKGFEEGVNSVEEGLPGWFGTFADMMTLLFAFFVLLAYLYLSLLYSSPTRIVLQHPSPRNFATQSFVKIESIESWASLLHGGCQ